MEVTLVQNGAACAEPWLLLDNCEEIVVVTDYSYKLLYINGRQGDIIPDAVDSLIGRALWDVFPEATDDLFETELRQAVMTRRAYAAIVDFTSVGRFLVRVLPHGDSAFSLFLRTATGKESEEALQVQEGSALSRAISNTNLSQELETARQEREAALQEAERTRTIHRQILTEVLATVTNGRLCLCRQESDMPELLPVIGEGALLKTSRSLAPFRRQIETASAQLGLPLERTRELIIAAGEAAMNGIVHAGGTMATLHGVPGSARIQVRFADNGRGIADANLHRALLERGYTTAGSLGLGFSMMHSVADRVYISTGSSGTTIVLEQGAIPDRPEETLLHLVG